MNRKYRDRESGENITIVIPVIICLVARTKGKQYTKRLLPDFLTPRSVIRLDYLWEAAGLPKTERSEDTICDLIGCLDPRTARHQMRRLTTAIEMVSLDLAQRRAATPELGNLPVTRPETPPARRLGILFDAETLAGGRAGRIHTLPPLRKLLQAAMGKHPENKPLNRASPFAQPP